MVQPTPVAMSQEFLSSLIGKKKETPSEPEIPKNEEIEPAETDEPEVQEDILPETNEEE